MKPVSYRLLQMARQQTYITFFGLWPGLSLLNIKQRIPILSGVLTPSKGPHRKRNHQKGKIKDIEDEGYKQKRERREGKK